MQNDKLKCIFKYNESYLNEDMIIKYILTPTHKQLYIHAYCLHSVLGKYLIIIMNNNTHGLFIAVFFIS